MRSGKFYNNESSELYLSSDRAFERYMSLILKEMRSYELDEVIGREKNIKWGFHIDGSWDVFIKKDGLIATTKILIEKKEVK